MLQPSQNRGNGRPCRPPRDVINRGHLLPEGLKAPLLRTGSRTASALSLLAMSEGSKPYKFACIERRHAVYCHVSAAHLGRLPVSFLISQRRAPLWYSQARAVLYVGAGCTPAPSPQRFRLPGFGHVLKLPHICQKSKAPSACHHSEPGYTSPRGRSVPHRSGVGLLRLCLSVVLFPSGTLRRCRMPKGKRRAHGPALAVRSLSV